MLNKKRIETVLWNGVHHFNCKSKCSQERNKNLIKKND